MAFMRYDYRALPPVGPGTTVEEFRAWLAQFDADGDGRISREELREALRSLDVWFAWWKAREALRVADANRNGLVDGDEMGRLYAFARRNLHLKLGDLQEAQLTSL